MALGASLAEANPLQLPFVRRLCVGPKMSFVTRSILDCQFIKTVALSDLPVRAVGKMGITPEDRALIQSLVLAFSEVKFSQAFRATVSAFRERS